MRLPHWVFGIAALVACALPGRGAGCEGTAAYTPCELTFELAGAEAAANPHPYLSVQLAAEFKSPRFKTFKMPAFWAGGNKLVIRFTPTEAGAWEYRLVSNVKSFAEQHGAFTAAGSSAPGFVQVANVHHWATDNKQPHLWMGAIADQLAFLPEADAAAAVERASANHFNHLRVSVLGGFQDGQKTLPAPDKPNLAYFETLDKRLAAVHAKGITTDLLLASDPVYFTSLLPNWEARERFVRFVIARYAAYNIVWNGFEEWENAAYGRELLKEIGQVLKRDDPYAHPRTSGAKVTSAALYGDGWLNFIVENSTDDQVAAIEHQLYPVPFVANTEGARLWNVTVDGAYPEVRAGGEAAAKRWYEFVSDMRHWELEPYFDLDGGRGTALEDVEYLVYVEKPSGPVEVTVEKHGYDINWLNPVTGEEQPAKKYKGEHFTSEPPDRSHPWLLLIAREGRKESMLKSYKFESRPVPVQELESDAAKVPYEIAQPLSDSITAGKETAFAVKLKRQTRAVRSMMYLWTCEVPVEGRGFRVLGTGAEGKFAIPALLASQFPAVLTLHVSALNANGKVYTLDKVYQLEK